MKRLISGCAFIGIILLINTHANALTMIGTRAAWETAVGSYSDVAIPDTEFSTLTMLNLPNAETLTFDSSLLVLQVPNSWGTWSGGFTPKILYTQGNVSILGTFSDPWAFGFEMEPNDFSIYDMTLDLFSTTNGTGTPLDSLTQAVNGYYGAKFFGWTFGDDVKSMKLSIAGQTDFAFGRMVISDNQPVVPEPASLSLLGFGLLGLFGIRKKK